MSCCVRHRPKGNTGAEAMAVEVNAPTPADTIDQVRAMLPAGRVVTSVAPY